MKKQPLGYDKYLINNINQVYNYPSVSNNSQIPGAKIKKKVKKKIKKITKTPSDSNNKIINSIDVKDNNKISKKFLNQNNIIINPIQGYQNNEKSKNNYHINELSITNGQNGAEFSVLKIVKILEKTINKYKIKMGEFFFTCFKINDNKIKNNKNNRNTKTTKVINYINYENIDLKKEYYALKIEDYYYNKKIGLFNFGSNCYINSFIQILIHVPGFINQLKSYINYNNNTNYLLSHLINVADNPIKENISNLKAEFIKRNSNYKYYSQEDSQEFGSELLTILNDELSQLGIIPGIWNLDGFENDTEIQDSQLKSKKLKKLNDVFNNEDCDLKNQTIIRNYFYYYDTQLIVCNNKLLNINFNADFAIKLSFNRFKNRDDIIKLNDMIKQKYLTGNNKLIKLPLILNFTLLRAIIEQPLLIKTKVIPDEEIDMKDYMDKDFGVYTKSTKYALYALNVCIGEHKKYGHFYAYILINNRWYKFEDIFVYEVQKDSITQDLPNIYGIYYINKEYLYLFSSLH